nr:hypothetical protein [Streptomyces sp. MBT65]
MVDGEGRVSEIFQGDADRVEQVDAGGELAAGCRSGEDGAEFAAEGLREGGSPLMDGRASLDSASWVAVLSATTVVRAIPVASIYRWSGARRGPHVHRVDPADLPQYVDVFDREAAYADMPRPITG